MAQRCEELTGRQRWHNDHHAYPASARHELAWYEIDLGYYGILLFQKLGPASHVKTASLNPAVEERAMPMSQNALGTSTSEGTHGAIS
jgi:hypothetical protein